MESVGP